MDDMLVCEDLESVDEVKVHLEDEGLASKLPERLTEGAKALGLQVWGQRETLQWCKNGEVNEDRTKGLDGTCFLCVGNLLVTTRCVASCEAQRHTSNREGANAEKVGRHGH